ncbi:hypothetical protein J2755_001162 [Methanohalophilus levihalophilus]|uniref:hypothetical protein n=1 Tax=Methanohalophilus levihalophilus TaxID=1431282 RepID=UPI001AE68675|nr:hypothetical protein [Methanohalophilus levihalophilus]MBP2030228.1 hypothetical protein [Methanohalophilus levihalophilus]
MTAVSIKKIGALSLAKILGIIHGILGVIVGIYMTIMSFPIGFGIGPETTAAGTMPGIGSLLLLPLIYGVMGFAAGIITAPIYNGVAGKLGGIEIEVE